MAEADLLRQHADVLFRTDAAGRLVALNEPDGEAPPRLFLGRGRTNHVVRFRSDVSALTVGACLRLCALLPPWDGRPADSSLFEPLRLALGGEALIAVEERGSAFLFGERVDPPVDAEAILIDERSAHLLERNFPYTQANLGWRSPVVGVIEDGAVVSACYSARRTATACEAGVDTEESYRGRGYAPLVVAGWRTVVELTGAVPLYSTTWDNAVVGQFASARRAIASSVLAQTARL